VELVDPSSGDCVTKQMVIKNHVDGTKSTYVLTLYGPSARKVNRADRDSEYDLVTLDHNMVSWTIATYSAATDESSENESSE
jgi:hypothetical protein